MTPRSAAQLLLVLACALQLLPTSTVALLALSAAVAALLRVKRPVAVVVPKTTPLVRRTAAPVMRQSEPTAAGRTQARAPGCGR